MAPRSESFDPRQPHRVLAVFVALFLVVSLAATPVGATPQPEPDAEPDAATEAAEVVQPSDGEQPSQNEQPPEGEQPVEGQAPELPAEPPDAPETGVEPTETSPEPVIDPDNPLANEGPGEEAPDVDITVPPKNTYEQEEFRPAEVLWSSVSAAEQKLNEATAAKESAIANVHLLRKRRKELDRGKIDLDDETTAVIDELTAVVDRLRSRAVVGYQRFGSGSDASTDGSMTSYQEVIGVQRRSKMVDSALDVDELDLDLLGELRSSLDLDTLALVDRIRVVSESLYDAETAVTAIDDEIEQAKIEYAAFRAGSEIFIHGVVFPIAGEYGTPFDSFGFPRMPGTPDEHWHEGIDLFAARGTPLVATERGVITKLGSGRLGGLKFWLKGESGTEWYYAHLDSFVPGLADGNVVEAGELVGYVGNTGNAIGTPPHLHMQVHPGGGDPVNPYPLLRVVSDLELSAIANGTHAGFDYKSYTVERPEQLLTDGENLPEQDSESEGDQDPASDAPVSDAPASNAPTEANGPPVASEDPATDQPAADIATQQSDTEPIDGVATDGIPSDGTSNDGETSDGVSINGVLTDGDNQPVGAAVGNDQSPEADGS